MIDTHAHLDSCDDEPAALIERARTAGVHQVITIGTGIESCQRALAIAKAHPEVFAVLGIDPHQASSPEADRVEELRELLADEHAVAVGETGLDGFHTFATPADQRALFERQLALADELALPVVIHSREAERETAAALEPFKGTVILHCFSSPALLGIATERGYYVSFAGNLTFPKAGELRRCAALVPSDKLLLETDSPYLAPQPVRGRRNEPANVMHTLDVLAVVRDDEPATLAQTIVANAVRAFGLP